MFLLRADRVLDKQSGADLIHKLKLGRNSQVPLRVTYTVESGKIIHDIHERKWKEWFSELFCNRSQIVEINRRVATALSTALSEDTTNRLALQHIHTLADTGTELSAARVYNFIFNTQVPLAPADPFDVVDKVDIEIICGNPSMMDAETYLLDIGDLVAEGRGHARGRPQLHAFASLADQAIERAYTKRQSKDIDPGVPVIEIPRCELKAQRVLVYAASPRLRQGVKDYYTAFFEALFTKSDIAGTLVVQLPKFEEGRDGLLDAVGKIKRLRDMSCRRIVFVSSDTAAVERFRHSINNQ